MQSVAIVLHKTKYEENAGYVARAMKNFNFENLILAEPECNITSEGLKRATHAANLLENARILPSIDEVFEEFNFVVGTSGIPGKEFYRSYITPKQLASFLKNSQKTKIAILFGSEEKGLGSEILKKCDFNVKIPTSSQSTVLNLSHAVSIVLYELFCAGIEPVTESENLVQKKKIFEKSLKTILTKLNYKGGGLERVEWIMRNLVYRGLPNSYEFDLLVGLLKNIERRL
jgi:TrmH family RNA methyltransferase